VSLGAVHPAEQGGLETTDISGDATHGQAREGASA
jgi:hypothetical protein